METLNIYHRLLRDASRAGTVLVGKMPWQLNGQSCERSMEINAGIRGTLLPTRCSREEC
jgi:hypothetical protein